VKRILLIYLINGLIFLTVRAAKITGKITDENGKALPYASILLKGTTKGVAANNEGKYSIDMEPGDYTLICQYVGYARQEKNIRIEQGQASIELDFQLSQQQLSMAEIEVRPGGEDPAYAIIRHAIQKRKDNESPLDSFSCEAYIKTQVKTRKIPSRILGQKVQPADKKQIGVDSAGKGIIFLSESLTRVGFKKPGKIKLEVLSGRESGSNGYGFSFPTFINFYNNNVTVLSSSLNQRGFVSPIAEAALHYYHYKYLGSFWEDGKEINKIQVIPRRKYEPLFSGTINIIEGEWRIHSLDLLLLRQSQLEVLDTLQIRQIQMPVGKGVWQTKDQVLYFTFNLFGIDAVGSFLNVYSKYELAPQFRKKYFNNVVVIHDTAGNRKPLAYWDSVRPLPLEPEELENYRIRDSIYRYNRDSLGSRRNRDTLLRRQGHIKPVQLLTGFKRSNYNPAGPLTYSLESLINNLQYNTVEGLNIHIAGTLTKTFLSSDSSPDSSPDSSSNASSRSELSITPHIRYGFHNTHLNAWATVALNKRVVESNGEETYSTRQNWTVSGGKRVSQFNGDNPISETMNGLYTLWLRRNYMKIYENYFGEIQSARRLNNGLRITINAVYEDRMPLDNTTDFSFIQIKNRDFTPNYPFEKLSAQFVRHQAFLTGFQLQYRPGQQYIEFPDRKIAIGSKYPTLSLSYQKGWNDIMGSNVNFDKWQFAIWDKVNLKLRGLLRYRFNIGGFLNTRSVFIQDYQHFNGNQTLFAGEYLNSFQLAPYYANSTTAAFYTTGHIEQHFNGFLTNKIPLFRRLNWWLVGSSNAFYVNRGNNYVEVAAGLENIFRLMRVDIVGSYLNGRNGQVGVRIGLGGVFGDSFLGRK
jgi:hypothetical protein